MPLKPEEIEKFKKKLEELRSRMSSSAKNSNDIGDTSDWTEDEQADSVQNAAMEMVGKDLKVLRQIARALEKIGENTYGICDLTGEEISIARLEAVPYAVTTVKAQEKL